MELHTNRLVIECTGSSEKSRLCGSNYLVIGRIRCSLRGRRPESMPLGPSNTNQCLPVRHGYLWLIEFSVAVPFRFSQFNLFKHLVGKV